MQKCGVAVEGCADFCTRLRTKVTAKSLHSTTIYYLNYYTLLHRMQKCGVAVEGCAAPLGCTIEFSDLTYVSIQYLNQNFKLNSTLINYTSIFYIVWVNQYNIIYQFSIYCVCVCGERERERERERETSHVTNHLPLGWK